mmetsp:Transcript_79697/g.185030  ORF Transcript_79697/g.185030 Transcript_79697/m.185030 type:complete len:204 (+) Transcript_79697:752-1363(+)
MRQIPPRQSHHHGAPHSLQSPRWFAPPCCSTVPWPMPTSTRLESSVRSQFPIPTLVPQRTPTQARPAIGQKQFLWPAPSQHLLAISLMCKHRCPPAHGMQFLLQDRQHLLVHLNTGPTLTPKHCCCRHHALEHRLHSLPEGTHAALHPERIRLSLSGLSSLTPPRLVASKRRGPRASGMRRLREFHQHVLLACTHSVLPSELT